MLKGVIFDLDNTLYPYDICHKKAETCLFRMACEDLGLPQIEFQKAYSFGKQVVKSRLGEHAASHNRLLYIENALEFLGQKPAHYALKFYNAYWDTFLETMTPFPWVFPLLDRLLVNNTKICLCSDLTAHIQYRKLERLGIASYFDFIVTSEEAILDKPSPKMFLLSLEKLKLCAQDCLFVGDHLAKDITGAKNIGMRTLLVKNDLYVDFSLLAASQHAARIPQQGEL